MAYELYITRAAHWSANQGHKISRAEWDHLVADDPTLTPDAPDDDAPPAQVQWRHTPDALPATLAYDVGNLLCRNPDEPAVEKLLALAHLLGARLQGHDGEIYTTPHDRPELQQAALFERAAWRLRVRFPQIQPAQEVTPDAPAVADGVAESDEPIAPRPGPRRMAIPFPSSTRSPSPALRTLLQPIAIAQFPAPPGLTRAS